MIMIHLEENKGIPHSLLVMMSVMAGLTVANLYYNQPLLEVIRNDIGITEVEANLITAISQVGYSLGLCFIIPMGDLFSRRRIVVCNMSAAVVSSLVIATADSAYVIWTASLVLGAASVVPQLFIPIAGQYSLPKDKARNMGVILGGMLTGIMGARVISGFVGDVLGWRAMFLIAAAVMVCSMVIVIKMMPDIKRNFSGSYSGLMASVWHIFRTHPRIRMNSLRGAFAFGSMMAVWSCMSFHVAAPPFNAGSDVVGFLGLCGVGGAMVASTVGKYVPRYGLWRFSLWGALIQLLSWLTAWVFSDSYTGLVVAILLTDIGLQCQQLSNQSSCIQEVPDAANRANTIFMTAYFIGGSFGTFFSGIGWNVAGWPGVCTVGILFALGSLSVTLIHGDRTGFTAGRTMRG